MIRQRWLLSFRVIAIAVGLLLSGSIWAYAQSPDSLPRLGADRLEPEAYTPSALDGLDHLATHPLKPGDRDVLRGAQAASKARWIDTDRSLFVATDAYIFDSVENAKRTTECGFLSYVDDNLAARYIGCPSGVGYGEGVEPAQIAGLPVATIRTEQADLETTTARYAISYQQGRLVIRVEVVHHGRVVRDLREAEEAAKKASSVAESAARAAFEQLVAEARKRAKR